MKFYMPTKIIFGSGSISQVKEIVEELGASRLFLVTDKGIVREGIATRVLAQLPKIHVFDGVEPNPRYTTVNKAGKAVGEINPDLVIGLGGGSALDAAKAIALLARNGGNIEDYEGRGRYKTAPLPVLAIPTTCGTGSEVTWVSVITHSERRFKMSIKGPEMFPKVALIDPDLLVSLPQPLIASTGIDALTHAIEAYTVKPSTFLTRFFARKATEMIFRYIERAYNNIKEDKEAREGMMLASTLAGLAFGNSDVGAVHCLSESVGSLYDTPHGVANSIFLPSVLEFNLPASEARYAELAEVAGVDGESERQKARKFIERIKLLCRSLSIPTFKELGIRESKFLEIAQKSFQNNSHPSNPREASVEDYLGILKKLFGRS